MTNAMRGYPVKECPCYLTNWAAVVRARKPKESRREASTHYARSRSDGSKRVADHG